MKTSKAAAVERPSVNAHSSRRQHEGSMMDGLAYIVFCDESTETSNGNPELRFRWRYIFRARFVHTSEQLKLPTKGLSIRSSWIGAKYCLPSAMADRASRLHQSTATSR